MGIGDILFGSAPKTEKEQMETMTPEQKEQLDLMLSRLGGRAAQPGISGPSAAETTSLAGLEQLAMNLVSGGAGADLLANWYTIVYT